MHKSYRGCKALLNSDNLYVLDISFFKIVSFCYSYYEIGCQGAITILLIMNHRKVTLTRYTVADALRLLQDVVGCYIYIYILYTYVLSKKIIYI